MDIRKAARPNNTFCDDFIITLYFSAVSPMNLPEATTAPVVSIVPPSHAPPLPVTAPFHCQPGHDVHHRDGYHQNERYYVRQLFIVAFMAPHVAIAADTPQIDTALASMVDISSSTFIFRATQNAKYHTPNTTTRDCSMPKNPALSISGKYHRRAEYDKPGLDEKFALHGGAQP